MSGEDMLSQFCCNGCIILTIEMSQSGTEREGRKVEDFSHSHPYEYLTNLNKIYSTYNHTAVQDFSSASKIKLPFYKFSAMKVPLIFETSYAKEKKEMLHFNPLDPTKDQENERRLWKEHREIIQRYLHEKENKKPKLPKNKNKDLVDKILSKDRNNIFLKKIIEKGTRFQYDQTKLQQEVIQKLKTLKNNNNRSLVRCQTAKCTRFDGFKPKTETQDFHQQKEKVKQNDYLQFDNERDLVVKYKGLIKKVDCSISEKSITKNCQILQQMQKMVDYNNYL